MTTLCLVGVLHDVVHSLLGLSSCDHEHLRIFLDGLLPALDVADRIVHDGTKFLFGEPESVHHERGRQLGNQLLSGVHVLGLGIDLGDALTVEPGLMSSRVTHLMTHRVAVMGIALVATFLGHLDGVVGRSIESSTTAELDLWSLARAESGYQLIKGREGLVLERLGLHETVMDNTFRLLHIPDQVGTRVERGAGSVLSGVHVGVVVPMHVPVEDVGSLVFLTFLDLATMLFALGLGDPVGAIKACEAQDHDVRESGVGSVADQVSRHVVADSPGSNPRYFLVVLDPFEDRVEVSSVMLIVAQLFVGHFVLLLYAGYHQLV